MTLGKQTPNIGPILAVTALLLLIPVLMGGCGEFGSQVVDAFDAFTRSIVNAALDLFFNQFRGSSAT